MSLILEDYRRLSAITGQMREAADHEQWDELIALEQRCANEVETLKPRDAVPSEPLEREQKAMLIRKILADDKAIRERTEPWMRQLQQIMQSARSEWQLQQTYLAQR